MADFEVYKHCLNTNKHKPTNVGRNTLERQARQFNSGAVVLINFSLWVQHMLPRPPGIRTIGLPNRHPKHFQLLYQKLILALLQPIISNKLYFGVRAIEITQN